MRDGQAGGGAARCRVCKGGVEGVSKGSERPEAGQPRRIYPKPYSIYLRGTIGLRVYVYCLQESAGYTQQTRASPCRGYRN